MTRRTNSHNIIRRLAIIVVVAGVFFAAPGRADSQPAVAPLPPEPDGLTLTPFLATSFGGDLASSPATFGAALGYGANRRITLEAEIAVAPDARQGQLIEVDTSFWSFSGNVLYHFSAEDFTPYGAIGIGLVSADPDVPISVADGDVVENDSTSFALNFGGGVKAALNERFGLRADLRYVNAGDAAPDHWRFYGGLVIRRIGQ